MGKLDRGAFDTYGWMDGASMHMYAHRLACLYVLSLALFHSPFSFHSLPCCRCMSVWMELCTNVHVCAMRNRLG